MCGFYQPMTQQLACSAAFADSAKHAYCADHQQLVSAD